MDNNLEDTEAQVVSIITNEASEPLELPNRKLALVFKRPTMVDKFRQRAWAAKKLRSFGLTNPDIEEPSMTVLFRYWGIINSYITRILVEDAKGTIKANGKKYREYLYDAATDLDYNSLFEKYVMEEIYEKGLSEEAFVTEVVPIHSDWVENQRIPEEADIKNS